jgi:hypothetical protein
VSDGREGGSSRIRTRGRGQMAGEMKCRSSAQDHVRVRRRRRETSRHRLELEVGKPGPLITVNHAQLLFGLLVRANRAPYFTSVPVQVGPVWWAAVRLWI